jgi:hypothetical protein
MFNLEHAIADWRQKLLAAGIETPVPLEELELHLREDVERQMSAGLEASQAFALAVERIGEAGELKAEFSNAGTMIGCDHQRIYDEVLSVYALFTSLVTLGLIFWPPYMYAGWSIGAFWMGLAGNGLLRTRPYDPDVINSVPFGVIWLNLIYGFAMAATLLARRYRPKLGARLTRLLNWALLPALPLGTLIGLYGMWHGKFEKFNATINSRFGKLVTFRMKRTGDPNNTTGERLVTAGFRIIFSGLAARLGYWVMQRGFELYVSVVLAYAQPSALSRAPRGLLAAVLRFFPEHILAFFIFPLIVGWCLIAGSFLLWCAWLMVRSAWAPTKAIPAHA